MKRRGRLAGMAVAATLVVRVFSGDMVALPGGNFVMGTGQGEADERPAHEVRISPFQIDRREVTFAEYDSCVRHGPCSPARYDDGRCLMLTPEGFRRVRVPHKYRSADRPVVCVTWEQARTYCRWRGKRLPSEAEWEYAALGGTESTYAWGDQPPSAERCTPLSSMSPRPVGSHAPNAWGLYDMTGNVWEWTNDWYQRDYYAVSEQSNPQGSPVGQYRVVRGGGWYSGPSHLRVRNREWFTPASAEVSIGFRCAR